MKMSWHNSLVIRLWEVVHDSKYTDERSDNILTSNIMKPGSYEMDAIRLGELPD